jgi:hypothetical protein
VTPYALNRGNPLSTGTYQLDCGNGPLQYGTNGGTFTLVAPTNSGSCIIYLVNNSAAVVPGYSGFTIGINTGDTYVTTNTYKFFISITCIASICTYYVKALQ